MFGFCFPHQFIHVQYMCFVSHTSYNIAIVLMYIAFSDPLTVGVKRPSVGPVSCWHIIPSDYRKLLWDEFDGFFFSSSEPWAVGILGLPSGLTCNLSNTLKRSELYICI